MFYRMSNKLKPAINVNWRVICRRSLFYFRINTSWRYYLEQFGTCLLQPILYQCSLKFDWFPVFCSICCVSRYLPTITWIPWQFTHFVPMLPCIYFSGFQYLAVFLAEMLVNEGICTKWRNFRPGMIKLESIEINGNIAQNVFINFFCETTWDKNSETAHTRRHWCFCGTPPLLGSILRLSWKYCFSSDKYPWCLFNLETSIWFNCGTY